MWLKARVVTCDLTFPLTNSAKFEVGSSAQAVKYFVCEKRTNQAGYPWPFSRTFRRSIHFAMVRIHAVFHDHPQAYALSSFHCLFSFASLANSRPICGLQCVRNADCPQPILANHRALSVALENKNIATLHMQGACWRAL